MGLGLNSDGIRDPFSYARRVLDDECATLSSTAHGRNDQTNRSAFACGRLVPNGYLSRHEVEHRIMAAAEASGIVRKDGAGSVRASMRSGLESGMREPRDLGNGEAPAATIHILRPKPRLSGVDLPEWTTPDPETGKPKFGSVGRDEPFRFDDEARRHLYRRDGVTVRAKVKSKTGGFIDWYLVRRTDTGEVGWQPRKPEGFVPVPYVPVGCRDPFDPERCGEDLVWAEGEKDADAFHAAGFLAFTFGSASDVPDVSELLRDHAVIVAVDNDDAGRKSIPRKVGAAIAAGARSVRLVQFAGRADGFDAADFFAAGGDSEAFLDLAERIDPAAWQAEQNAKEAGAQADDGFGPKAEAMEGQPRASSVFVYGDVEPESPPWFVRGMLPQKQVAILGGQSRAGKTFVALHLSLCAMRGLPFIDYEVERPGAVLWLAAEMASEVSIRLKAAASMHCGDALVGQLPFVQQRFEVPSLSKPDALEQLMALVREAKAVLAERFPGVDLVLIVLDTLGSAADFQDENSAAETQRIMSLLRRLSDGAGALVVAVDHYGKAETTGVRGSSAKTAAADAILGVLADIDNTTGEISNRRLTIQKLRSAPTGRVVPFNLKPVPIDAFGNTHCGVAWDTVPAATNTGKTAKPAWSGKSRLLKSALEVATIEHGQKKRPYGNGGPEVKAVDRDRVRTEFYASYTAESAEAKRKAFNRMVEQAQAAKLIGVREINGADWLWLVNEDDPQPQAA